MVIYLVKDDGLAQCLRKFPSLSIISLLEVNDELEDLTAVSDRNSNVLPSRALLLIYILDERINLGDHGVHTSAINLHHMIRKSLLDIILLGI